MFGVQELTNAYEKIMEQRRGADDKGSKAQTNSFCGYWLLVSWLWSLDSSAHCCTFETLDRVRSGCQDRRFSDSDTEDRTWQSFDFWRWPEQIQETPEPKKDRPEKAEDPTTDSQEDKEEKKQARLEQMITRSTKTSLNKKIQLFHLTSILRTVCDTWFVI